MSDYISTEIKLFHCILNVCVLQTYIGFLQLVLIYRFFKSTKYIKLNKSKYKNLYRKTAQIQSKFQELLIKRKIETYDLLIDASCDIRSGRKRIQQEMEVPEKRICMQTL